MSEISPVASFRRVTPGIVASSRLAMANDVPDTSKGEIAVLLKQAAPIFGIDGTTYHVMDILLGLSRAEDWKGDGRPVVAISNAKLAEYTMRSERTVIRCIRRLVEAGIASYRDSSTGRRFVYRDSDGAIIAGYGIDFTPARVRLAEIKTQVEAYRAKLANEAAARRDVSRLARAIEDLCGAFPDIAEEWREEAREIDTKTLSLLERAEAIRELYSKAVDAAQYSTQNKEMAAKGDIDVIHNTYTTLKTLTESKKQQPRSTERTLSRERSYAAQKAFEKKPDARRPSDQAASSPQGISDIQTQVLGSVSIGLLKSACPEAQTMVATAFDNWSSLARSGEMLRRMIGLSESGWQDGQHRVGVYVAAAILATVVEKSIRDPDQISKPGGYFRAMVERAVEGKLNLERTLFGLADGRYGT